MYSVGVKKAHRAIAQYRRKSPPQKWRDDKNHALHHAIGSM